MNLPNRINGSSTAMKLVKEIGSVTTMVVTAISPAVTNGSSDHRKIIGAKQASANGW